MGEAQASFAPVEGWQVVNGAITNLTQNGMMRNHRSSGRRPPPDSVSEGKRQMAPFLLLKGEL